MHPLKKKFLRANHAPYMTKTLRKAIVRRSQLQTKYFKNKSQNDYLAFKKQRNFCSKLYKKERKNYYNSLDIKNITDNKQFWKTIKPFLSEKIKTTSKIKLKDKIKSYLTMIKLLKNLVHFLKMPLSLLT